MTVLTQTCSARHCPPPLPPTRTMLAAGDEFDPHRREGMLFFCWCVGTFSGGLARNTGRLLAEIERCARCDVATAEINAATDAARFDATEGIHGMARIVVRFAEAILGRPLRTAPTLFTEFAELIFIRRTGQPIIDSSKVEIIKAELRCTWIARN